MTIRGWNWKLKPTLASYSKRVLMGIKIHYGHSGRKFSRLITTPILLYTSSSCLWRFVILEIVFLIICILLGYSQDWKCFPAQLLWLCAIDSLLLMFVIWLRGWFVWVNRKDRKGIDTEDNTLHYLKYAIFLNYLSECFNWP